MREPVHPASKFIVAGFPPFVVCLPQSNGEHLLPRVEPPPQSRRSPIFVEDKFHERSIRMLAYLIVSLVHDERMQDGLVAKDDSFQGKLYWKINTWKNYKMIRKLVESLRNSYIQCFDISHDI